MATVGVQTASELLGVSPATVRRWDDGGLMPGSTRRGRSRYRRWNLEELLTFAKNQPGPERHFRSAPPAAPGP